MKPTVHERRPVSRRDKRVAIAAAVRKPARPGVHLNALKHGLTSGSVLLPGDDMPAFCRMRERLFHLHRPRTIEEAQCVETIAAGYWRIARCRTEQALFKRHLGAVLSGDPDATGLLCGTDPHRIHHRGTDCSLEERRLEKSMASARADLMVLQKHRTQNFPLAGSAVLEDYETFLREGAPTVEATTGSDTAPAPAPAARISRSTDGRNGFRGKRNAPSASLPATIPAPVSFPGTAGIMAVQVDAASGP